MSQNRQSHVDDPLLQALRSLPRDDLSAAALVAQRRRLHAELERVRQRTALPHMRWVSGLEAALLWICGGCVLVRLSMILALLVRAGV